MKQQLQAAVLSVEEKLAELRKSKLKPLADVSDFPRSAGVYIVYNGKRALYVGIATNLKRRLQQHIEDRRVSSALTLKLAFIEANIVKKGGRYPQSREKYFRNEEFLTAYKAAAKKVRRMKVRFIEVNSAPLRIILEAYAGMLFKTELNDFNLENAL